MPVGESWCGYPMSIRLEFMSYGMQANQAEVDIYSPLVGRILNGYGVYQICIAVAISSSSPLLFAGLAPGAFGNPYWHKAQVKERELYHVGDTFPIVRIEAYRTGACARTRISGRYCSR